MTALPLVAALAWVTALIVNRDPFSGAGVLLVGVGLVATSTVSVVGMTVAGGRWAHRLALSSVAGGLVVAALRPIDILWGVGLTITVLAGSFLFLPAVTSRVRRLPSATGPPQAAVVVPLLLLASPFLIGVALGNTSPWSAVVVGLAAPIAAFAFSRVMPGGLLVVRLFWPALAIGLAPLIGIPAGVVSTTLGVAVAALSWRGDVKASFHPPREVGTSYPIPPELAPRDILDAANIDEKGQRR